MLKGDEELYDRFQDKANEWGKEYLLTGTPRGPWLMDAEGNIHQYTTRGMFVLHKASNRVLFFRVE